MATCPVCGVDRTKSDCMGDEGYGCPDWEDYKETVDCTHEEFELDILTGRASCNMCDHYWYASDAEYKRHAELMGAPYPADDEQTK